MAASDEGNVPAVRVTRKKRRLYDPLPIESIAIESGSAVEVLVPEVVTEEPKERHANKIIGDFVKWSAGSALIPVPILDVAAVTTLQLIMVKQLCTHYEMEYSKQRVKAIVVSLTAGLHAGAIAGSLFKAVPFIGPTFAVASAVAVSGALTYAVGKVFVLHFEAGGTLMDFDPSKMRSYFERQFKEGRKHAEEIEK